MEQKQQSAEDLITEYQHLFALNLNELGKTSLVQHDIKLDDMTPFKEWYRMIPPHQYEEVKKHLQEMLEIGAIRRSISPWASPVVLVQRKDGVRAYFSFCLDNMYVGISQEQIRFLCRETSFHQLSNMASSGLKKMFI